MAGEPSLFSAIPASGRRASKAASSPPKSFLIAPARHSTPGYSSGEMLTTLPQMSGWRVAHVKAQAPPLE